MGAPFHWGVPYLSRDEQARAIAKEHEKRDISNLRDIKLGRDEVESRKFVDRARRTIRAWYKSRVSRGSRCRKQSLTVTFPAAP